MKSYSIKRRLIASVLLVELASAASIGGLAFFYERHSHFRAFDIMLRGRADSLLGAVQDADDAQDHVMLDGSQASLPKRDIYEVWDQNLRVLGKSPNWAGLDPARLETSDGRADRLVEAQRRYRAIRVDGVRNVDPGGSGGGIPRRVIIVYGSPTAPAWRAIWTGVEFYALAGVVLLAITGLVMFWLLNDSLAPLTALAKEAAKVSAVSWSFRPSGRMLQTVELAPLAAALETALKGLEHSFLQQRRFVSDAAHELKTGVAVVKSSLQLLAMKPRSAEEYEAGLERCQADCDRMQSIVAEMLTLARIEDQPDRMRDGAPSATANLAKTASEVADRFRPMAEAGGIEIEVAAPRSLFLDIEEEQLQLLCSNLLLNALQHSYPGGAVRILAEEMEDCALLRIVDVGEGIDPALQPHIFERFFRGDPSRSRKTGGTGLGLSICEAIVQRFRGEIRVTSRPGEGTTVAVRLPIHAETIPKIPPRAELANSVDRKN